MRDMTLGRCGHNDDCPCGAPFDAPTPMRFIVTASTAEEAVECASHYVSGVGGHVISHRTYAIADGFDLAALADGEGATLLDTGDGRPYRVVTITRQV